MLKTHHILTIGGRCCKRTTLEEILSISTLLSTRPSTLSPKKCINKSICWHPEATRGVPMEGAPPVGNQIDFVMPFLGDSVDVLVERRVEMDKISSSVEGMESFP